MRKLFFIAIVFVCSNSGFGQVNKYVTFQAEIANKFGDVISFTDTNNKLIKKIQVDKEGVFRDTLNVVPGRYQLFDGNEITMVYLKNGFDLKLKMDATMFDESIVYTGNGAAENNFLAQNALFT